MAEIVTHNFVSAKAQSPDTTLVSKNEWNDGHLFAGGTQGQILVYDNTELNNVKWVDGPNVVNGSATTGATSSPYISSTLVTITPSTNIAAVVEFDSIAVTSGAAAFTMELLQNGSPILAAYPQASGSNVALSIPITFSPGTYNLAVKLTAISGTFTSASVAVRTFTIGKI